MKLALPSFDMARARLVAETLAWRCGWMPIVAVLLLLAALALLLLVTPVQRLRVQAMEEELSRLAEQSATRVAVAPAEPPLKAFQRTLMPQEQTNELLRHLSQLARDNGVTLTQADLRRVNDNAGVASQLQIALPMRGEYLAMRRFCLSMLAAIPALSIDQVLFKREMVSSSQVDAQIILSVWQLPERRAAATGEQP